MRSSTPVFAREAAPARYLNTAEAAQYLRVSPRTLEKWRLTGEGPVFRRLGGGRAVRYALEELDEFAGDRRRTTSDLS